MILKLMKNFILVPKIIFMDKTDRFKLFLAQIRPNLNLRFNFRTSEFEFDNLIRI